MIGEREGTVQDNTKGLTLCGDRYGGLNNGRFSANEEQLGFTTVEFQAVACHPYL